MDEIRGPAGRTMWDKLGSGNEAVLANYLKNEYPQTVAVVLSKVRPEHAANVRPCCPRRSRSGRHVNAVHGTCAKGRAGRRRARRCARIHVLNLARSTRRDAHETMADIFNSVDRQAEVARGTVP